MEHRWNEIDRGKLKYSEKNLSPVPLCPPQIPRGLTRDRTRSSAVGGRQAGANLRDQIVKVIRLFMLYQFVVPHTICLSCTWMLVLML
jgi:hypothetical protein